MDNREPKEGCAPANWGDWRAWLMGRGGGPGTVVLGVAVVLAGLCACSVGAFACSFGYPGRGITTMVLGFVLVHLGVRQAVPRAAPAEFLTFVALSFGGSSFFLPLFRIPIVPRIPGFGQGPIGWGGALPALAALVGIVYGAVALALYRGRDELPDWGKKLAQVSVLAAMPALLVWGTMWLSGSGCR